MEISRVYDVFVVWCYIPNCWYTDINSYWTFKKTQLWYFKTGEREHQDTVCDNVKEGKTIQSPLHCTEKLLTLFPEMKLRELAPNFYIHVLYLRATYVFPWKVLFRISIFLHCMRELSAQPKERREGQGTAAKQWWRAVPCPPLRSCDWAKSSHKWPTNRHISNLE